MTHEDDRYRAMALDPQWEKTDRVHDWRNYIFDEIRAIWETFTLEQRVSLVKQADQMADREEWD